jgi:hypothetical protein
MIARRIIEGRPYRSVDDLGRIQGSARSDWRSSGHPSRRSDGDDLGPGSRQAYQDPATGRMIKPGAKPSDAYEDVNLSVAKRWLDRAQSLLASTDTVAH